MSQIFNILKYKTISLGDLKVRELTLLEYKPWFSTKIFYFCKGSGQDRFHTHSFESWSFRLWGDYIEHIIDDENYYCNQRQSPRSRKRLLYIPKDRFHMIGKSRGCLTLLITTGWGDVFREYKDGKVIKLTHGRRQL